MSLCNICFASKRTYGGPQPLLAILTLLYLQDLIPPKDPEIQVRALQDYGEMVASNGTIHFQKNAVFFMAQEDAEPLIRQRVLERMDMADLH